MISDELRAKIRRLYFGEHWKVGTIAAQLSVHHETVTRALELDQRPPPPRRVQASIVDPYKPLIQSTLEQYPRLRATRLYEMLLARGYAGSYHQVRRYVRSIRPKGGREAFKRLRTLPGEQAQVDWGSFGKRMVGKARRHLSCFVMVLSWSRAIYARFFWDQKLESFLEGHAAAFEAFGGVPRELLYDNLKSAVLERDGEHVRFHPQILELAGHYHFAPKPCAPYRANEKGKVERAIQYLRHSFFAARDFSGLDDLNEQLARWLDEVAHQRKVPGEEEQRVDEALSLERERLMPLPQHPLSCARVVTVRSGKTPYVRFDLNDYSIPHEHVREPLTLIATTTKVRLTTPGGTALAEHDRCWDRGQTIEDERHVEALAREKRKAHRLRVRDRLRICCPNTEAFIEALSRRDGSMSHQTRRLVELLDRYGARELDTAMGIVLERGTTSANAVAYVLDQRARARGQKPPIDVVLPDDARVRDLHVTPHRLDAYDELTRINDDDQEEE